MDNLDKILEGLLFLSGDGLDRGIIMEKLQVTPKQLDKAVEILRNRYNDDCGINMITYKDKLQLCASPKYADDVSTVLNPIRERQLTKATLEVMAIIAYKQPVTRIDVQDIRGINSDYAIQTLLNYKLIEVVGRKDAIGKPLLFGTTDEFLRHFGINSLDELPDYDELMKNVERIQLENNHLYNEFEIPNEAENDVLESEYDQKIYENNTQQNESKSAEISNSNSSTETIEKNAEIETENLDNETKKILAENAELDLEEFANLNYAEMAKNQGNKNDEQIEYESASNDAGGIDWNLLENNPDIEVE